MAAKMERMEERFMKREEELKRQLLEMEQRMDTKIRTELATIKEAPQVLVFQRELYTHLTGALLRVPKQMELHGNSNLLPIYLKLQQCGPGVYTPS